MFSKDLTVPINTLSVFGAAELLPNVAFVVVGYYCKLITSAKFTEEYPTASGLPRAQPDAVRYCPMNQNATEYLPTARPLS
jgi:hypothetical protein